MVESRNSKMDFTPNYSFYKKWHRPFFLICIIITLAIVFLLLKISATTKGSEILTPIAEEATSPTPTFIKKKKNQISIKFINPRDGEKIEDDDAILIDIKVDTINRISKIKIFADNALVKTCFVTNFCSHWWNTKDIPKGNHIIQAEIQDSSSPQYIESKSIVVVR